MSYYMGAVQAIIPDSRCYTIIWYEYKSEGKKINCYVWQGSTYLARIVATGPLVAHKFK